MRLLERFRDARKAYGEANEDYLAAQNALLDTKEELAQRQADLLLKHTCENAAEREALYRTELTELYKQKADLDADLNAARNARREAELDWDLLRYELRMQDYDNRESALTSPRNHVSDEADQAVLG